MISAIVMIKADIDRIPEVAEAVVEIAGVTEVYSTTGDVDLIAIVRVARHEDLADVIADRINKISGMRESQTHIAFRTYSSGDLGAGFSLGLDD